MGREKEPGTHCLCMLSFPRISGRERLGKGKRECKGKERISNCHNYIKTQHKFIHHVSKEPAAPTWS